jgi:integrase
MGKFTNLAVRNITEPGRHHDGGNLILAVYPSGAKCWIVRYRDPILRKRVELGLGGYPTVSLQQARRKAHETRSLLNDNRSPKAVRKEERRLANLPTFSEMSETFIGSKGAEWTSKFHRDRVHSILMKHCRPINDKLVTDIGTEDILDVIKVYMKQAPASAYRLRNTIEQILAGAQALGHIPQGTPNPARWTDHMDRLLPEAPGSKNFAAMAYVDVPGFMQRLRAMWRDESGRYNITALALSYLILCGSRSGEVIGARWPEIDLAVKTWTIPASRMKTKIEHTVPLSPSACEILSIMQRLRSSEFVFPGSRRDAALTAKALQRLLAKLGAECIVHGFRSALRDWSGDMTDADYETCERALSHTVGTQTQRRYRRGNPLAKLRDLFEQWDSYLHASAANVVPLRA